MATATKTCEVGKDPEHGNYLNTMALANKLDFAHLHGYELWVHAERVRAHLRIYVVCYMPGGGDKFLA